MKNSKYLLGLIALFFVLSPLTVSGFQELPTDPSVKIGTLDNGFTYYLRENKQPENRVEFRLAIKAGSILEDEDQQGLAHFAEHMLFNGTKNFEKNDLVDFLQKMGLEFGGDLNAYTSFDETVYILPIPTDDPENIGKALTVLSDWAHQATFDDEEIDKERGVVMEEWRLRLGAFERMRQQIWPVTLAGSRYAERLPIGKPEVLENFEYDAAKRFYRDWYRPSLMSLIAVGDFDAQQMEKDIKKFFGQIEGPKDPKERVYYSRPDFEGTRIAVASDEEATGNTISVDFITPGSTKTENTLESFRKGVLRGLYSRMINQRMNELVQTENPPFQFSFSNYGGTLGRDKSAYRMYVSVKEDKFKEGFQAAVSANERVRRYGFTAGEFERALASYKNSYERSVKEADKTESWRIINQYVSHFLNGGSLLSAQQRLEYFEQVMPTLKLEEVNSLADGWIRDDNRTIEINAKAADADKIPTEAEMISILDNARNDNSIKPYEEEKLASSLITSLPAPGKVTGESTNDKTGITQLTLSNGVNVYLKPTDFKNDEVRMTGFSFGGASLYGPDELMSVQNAGQIISQMGIGEFSSVDLGKFMTGKTASVNAGIGLYEESVSGFSSVKDLETFMQLLHLKFTSVRKDEKAYNSWLTRTKNVYSNITSSPDFQYRIQMQEIMYGEDNPWVGFPTPEKFDEINLDRAIEIYKERFSNAADFQFVFVGNIDMDTFKPLLEQYVATLPASDKKESYKDVGLQVRKGQISENVYVGVDEKSQVNITISGDYDYSMENNGLMNAIAGILSNKMIETLREEMGGVYGAGASARPTEYPNPSFLFSISFPCKPENVEALTQAALKELEKIKNGEFTDEDLQKIVTARKQNFEESIKQNNYWSAMMGAYLKSGDDFEMILKGNERADAVTREAIVAAANKYLTDENMIKVVKLPENRKEGDLKQEIKKN
ncbi:pitrilysin family protein [Roseivirga sp. E12]|uniref:M16 family metallopeptidase n=1 Tax=Roseivirga sp. E12 TaxID=2819237 RepID=UPI001ABC9072|nr:insulinase family protein [Roseivirga sp. E12]MBO3698879.1 insulinase family protein [Roseivirga sp. E12]